MRRPGIKNGSRTDEVFEFIKAEVARTGYFPTNRAILRHMGWSSPSAVKDTISRLVGQRRLHRDPATRALTVVA